MYDTYVMCAFIVCVSYVYPQIERIFHDKTGPGGLFGSAVTQNLEATSSSNDRAKVLKTVQGPGVCFAAYGRFI